SVFTAFCFTTSCISFLCVVAESPYLFDDCPALNAPGSRQAERYSARCNAGAQHLPDFPL
ncbi:hypothetical protein, partial [Pseudomonas sp. QD5]|uniref:hypothetical protein n=1 Tax=Pseudomonas sp. QD5 TaxID=3368619 RepID=UPI003B9EBC29